MLGAKSNSCSFIEIQEAPSAPSFTPYNYYHRSSASGNNRSTSPPAAALLPSSKAAKLHRVIQFHSSPSCRGFLEASKASNTLIVIHFTNGWGGRCRYMDPTLNEFAAKYTNVEFLTINVDELSDVSCEYGVRTTPTILLMKKGRVIEKVVGAKKHELQNKIEKHRI